MSKGKPLISPERCKGCALCVDACPKKILKMS
ncbi:MAG: 4Fe-4S binding protein, partial [Spirochaetaceae bacterium]|nr:4Fe-4S binding protein [Spirochaetaceae bacterium]